MLQLLGMEAASPAAQLLMLQLRCAVQLLPAAVAVAKTRAVAAAPRLSCVEAASPAAELFQLRNVVKLLPAAVAAAAIQDAATAWH